jgi:leucyl-tRNA synthetase
VQVNGKLRDRFSIAADADEQAVRAAALQCPKVIEALGDKQPARVIIVPKRLVNVIVK